ncbi:MAG: hypothetical protein H5T92_04010 [Synergistales bacterium]|nr:hypothetical protein [Synergistales bacterium]
MAKRRKKDDKPKSVARMRELKTEIAQEKFLQSIAEWANITEAAKAAGVGRSTHYHWLKDPAYRRRFLEAREAAYDRLERAAFERALAGSDRLLTFLLSAYRPKFRVDAPAVVASGDDLSDVPDDKLIAEAEAEARALGYQSITELWGGAS